MWGKVGWVVLAHGWVNIWVPTLHHTRCRCRLRPFDCLLFLPLGQHPTQATSQLHLQCMRAGLLRGQTMYPGRAGG